LVFQTLGCYRSALIALQQWWVMTLQVGFIHQQKYASVKFPQLLETAN